MSVGVAASGSQTYPTRLPSGSGSIRFGWP